MRPRSPITRLSAYAATSVTRGLDELDRRSTSDGNGCPDTRVRVIALDGDVLQVEGVDLLHRGVEPQGRQRPWLPGELEPGLVEVVRVEVRVAEGVHEVSDPEPGHLGHHVGEQGVRRDVERDAE